MSLLLLLPLLFLLPPPATSIGVNYGTLGDNLPPPSQVATFLRTKTTIDRVKLFDANPDILRAFANSGIAVSVTTPNGDIPSLAQLPGAQQWVAANIAPFYPATNIIRILVGNEVLHWGPQNLIDNLVAAMKTLRIALDNAGFKNIQVSTAHSLGILLRSWPPSTGRFRPGWDTGVLLPILQFHRETKSPFMVNPYPYFGSNSKNTPFCTFQAKRSLVDRYTKRAYTNMFDALMDAVLMGMRHLGHGDVDIVVGETGWPTVADGWPWVTPQTAQAYNGGLVKHLESGVGTPLMPKRKFEVYVFALFTENQKPGPIAEQNFGLFRPDFTPVYDAGLLRDNKPQPQPQPQPRPTPATGKQWCVSKPGVAVTLLQNNINYACGQGIDCGPIQSGGACFNANNQVSHANYVMNAYYQAKGHQPFNCDFSGTGVVTANDPSFGQCKLMA